MTKQQLQNTWHLAREIKKMERQFAEMTAIATSTTGRLTHRPKSSGTTDKVGNMVPKLTMLQHLMVQKKAEYVAELTALLFYIHSIQDSEIRQILTSRYALGRTWRQVAFDVGYGTEDSVRVAHNRFLDTQEPERSA